MTVRTAGRGLRNGVAVRGFMSGRGPTRSGGKDSPNGAYRSAGPGRQPSLNFVPRKRFKSYQMHQITNFVPQKRFNQNKLHHRQEIQEIPPKRQQFVTEIRIRP